MKTGQIVMFKEPVEAGEDAQQLAIKALENVRGDDLERAKSRWAGLTPEQMRAQHSATQTRADVLAELEARAARFDAAIAWLKALPTP